MVLPIPVVPGSAEDAVRFVNLESYKRFFADLDQLFPQHTDLDLMRPLSDEPVAAQAVLEVHDVGAFEASFVPTIPDFARLDPRFRLTDQVWGELGGYDDFGRRKGSSSQTRNAIGRLYKASVRTRMCIGRPERPKSA